MKASLVTWSVIVGLTLAAWLFFYTFSEPLDAQATTVVAGFFVVVVFGGSWFGRLLFNRRKPQ